MYLAAAVVVPELESMLTEAEMIDGLIHIYKQSCDIDKKS